MPTQGHRFRLICFRPTFIAYAQCFSKNNRYANGNLI